MKAIYAGAIWTAVLTFGFSDVARAGGNQSPAAPRCTVSTSAQSRLKEVAEYALKNPHQVQVPERLAEAMRLNLSGPPFLGKQAVIRNTDGIRTHILAADANGSGKYLIAQISSGSREFFLADAEFTAIATVRYERGALTMLNIADAEVCSRYRAEVEVWREAKFEDAPRN